MRLKSLGTMFLVGALAVMMPQWAQAAGTAVCTTISNTADLDYTVGGVPQAQLHGTTSGANIITVASKVNLTVTAVEASFVSVTPGATQGVLTFTVKNEGNTVQDYALTGAALSGGVTELFNSGAGSATDNFNGAAYSVFVETAGGAGYQSGSDTTDFIENLAPDATATVYVVISGSPAVLLSQLNGDVAAYSLLAETHVGGTVGLGANTTTATTVGACSAPVVLADTAAGTGPDDGDLDGDDSARGAFQVVSAILTITKTATTIWDPINYDGADAKSIPGALVRYVVTVSNANGAADATLTTIGDALAGSLTMDPDLLVAANSPTLSAENAAGNGFKVVVTAAGRATNGANQYFTTVNDSPDDGVLIAGQNITADLAKILPVEAGYATAGLLKANESFTLTFNVTIN